MTSFLQFALLLSIIITAAKLGGLLSSRIRQPAVLGELLMGLALGPSLLDLMHCGFVTDRHLEEGIFHLAELGVIFLMFVAGLSIDQNDFLNAGRTAFWCGFSGVVTPLALGTAGALCFGYAWIESLFIGVILTATSVSISAQTLMELGKLQTKEGIVLLAAAVIDDVMGIIVLSFFVAIFGNRAGEASGLGDILWVLARIVLYLGVSALVGVKVLPRLLARIARLPISEGVLSAVVVLVLLYSITAEQAGGIAAITGAFLLGIILSGTPVKENVEKGIHSMTYGFFVPIFFVSIGLKANARELGPGLLLFAVVLCVIAIVSKIIGCGLGTYWAGMDRKSALRVGVGMISRGEVGLIVASIGLHEHIIQRAVFSTVVIIVLATTLVTPVLLRWVFVRTE